MVNNPYLDEFQQLHQGHKEWSSDFIRKRFAMVHRYAWAIPDMEALEAIKSVAPNGVIEVGAGKGYWAHCLEQLGVDVQAYDAKPWGDNAFIDVSIPAYTNVKEGSAEIAGAYGDRCLFLCWPQYESSCAYDAAVAHMNAGGRTLVYVGEGFGGCCADDTFFELLEEHFEEKLYQEIPQWDGIHDHLYIFERKTSCPV